MSRALYVTGTDTGVGKTVVTAALLRGLLGRGCRACGMKPVASGADDSDAGLRNDDALALIAAGSPGTDYATINPYALRAPTAPEIAAERDGVTVEPARIEAAFARLLASHDRVLVEGVGGWLAPLAASLEQAELARRLRLPVLLVVGLRLGCINHARLTLRAIADDGCEAIGWIGNRVDPALEYAEETVAILGRVLPVPCLGVLAHAAGRDSEREQLKAALDRLA
jgi:dethiobiotin synthetase